jgi:hypothetical protein
MVEDSGLYIRHFLFQILVSYKKILLSMSPVYLFYFHALDTQYSQSQQLLSKGVFESYKHMGIYMWCYHLEHKNTSLAAYLLGRKGGRKEKQRMLVKQYLGTWLFASCCVY